MQEMRRIYLDHNATTPLDPRVRDEMLEVMGAGHGNPSSVHAFGRAAQERVEAARDRVAALIGARPPELIFTASGTEANNAVVFSCGRRAGWRGHLVISAFEHPSVLAAADRAEAEGMTVSRVPPDGDGRVAAAAILAALRDDTRLVCLMLANNEVGTLQPVAEVAAGCRERGVPVLCDAVQAMGKIGVQVGELEVDYLTLGAHKFYGPLGAAALWVRGGTGFEPLLTGGGQERRRRAGTVNVPAVAGLGKAAELAAAELDERGARTARLRDRFEAEVSRLGDVSFHGRQVARLPNTSHLAFSGIDAEALLIRLDLDGFAVSTGSACAAGAVEPSGALLAMGLSREEALSSLRVSFGPTNDDGELTAFLGALERQLAELRRLAPA
jgi:cysteine desulfurase